LSLCRKPAGSFKTRLTVNPLSDRVAVERPGVIYTNKVPLKPGLYQVRVAARDDRTGRVGSTARWIEVPDLAQKRLTLSNLMINGPTLLSAWTCWRLKDTARLSAAGNGSTRWNCYERVYKSIGFRKKRSNGIWICASSVLSLMRASGWESNAQ
jgi:hypothetical protein